MIGLIAVTAAGRTAAGRLAAAWPDETRVYEGPASAAVPRAWSECDALVCFLATGATVRLVAPLLTDKHTDPAVVCVDEAARYAIALVGGHAGGANDLAAGSPECSTPRRSSPPPPTRPAYPDSTRSAGRSTPPTGRSRR